MLMKKKRLYTDKAGKHRYNNKARFWAWEDDELAQGGIGFFIDPEDIELDDIGLYMICDSSSIDWIKD